MSAPDFIDLEIQRHCSNPRPHSAIMVDALPLVLWQVFLLAKDDCRTPTGVMRTATSLAAAACEELAKAGMIIGEGSLVRKVCGPLLMQNVSHCIGQRYKDAHDQQRLIRTRAEKVFVNQLGRLLVQYPSAEADALIGCLQQGDPINALYSGEARAFVMGRARSSAEVVPAIELGRRLFG